MNDSLQSRRIGAKLPKRRQQASGCRYRPFVEALEERALPSLYVVTNASDSGAGSLRQAILDSNANAANGPNLIAFTPQVTGPINLVTALPAIDNDVSLLAQGDDHNLTVERSSGTGTPNFRIFTINAGRTVNITGLTIANGRVLDDSGGGILNQGTLVLEQALVTSNTATLDQPITYDSGPGRGGGIDNLGTLTLRNSAVTKNFALNAGGGLLNDAGGTSALDHVVISDNSCTYDGAGVFSRLATLTIDASIISGNTTGAGGTGGLASIGALTMRNSLISGNGSPSANGNAGSAAGGIYFGGAGPVLISRSAILKNVGQIPGILEETFSGTALIEDSSISYNTGGPGFLGHGSGAIEIARSSIIGNGGASRAGGVDGTIKLEDSTISGNVGKVAGGIYGSGEIIRSTISGNTAIPVGRIAIAAGGVVGFLGGANWTIDNSTISGNTVIANQMAPYSFVNAAVAGGVLSRYSYNGSGTFIDHSTIAFNKVVGAPTGNVQISGGVTAETAPYPYQSYSARVTVRNTIIAKNQADAGEPDVAGAFQSLGHNLIGILGSGGSGFIPSDLTGTPTAPLDPRLLPLGWYGGPTQTHLLAANSPAINAGDPTNAPLTDQRGDPRVINGMIDIGSVERNPADARFGAGGSGALSTDLTALLNVVFSTLVHGPNCPTG
jgi:hypothetical protein